MKLLPALKQKKRYIVFEIISDNKFSASEVQAAVKEALHSFLGELGIAKAGPMFIKEKYTSNKFILKVNHKYVDECKSALILIKTIKKRPVIFRSVITSGTIKKASTFL